MKLLRASLLCACLALAALTANAGSALAVAVSAGSGSGLAGQTVDIDINTASLTGLNVTSLQFDLRYVNTSVVAVDVIPAGSLTAAAGWSAPVFGVSNSGTTGTIRVNTLGTSPIVGAGSLLKVRFLLDAALLNGGSSALTLANVMFNEGSPAVTTTNGTLTIGITPQINITPDSGELVRGSTLQFSVTGTPTLPVGYATSNNAVATISSSGLLTGVAPGAITVTATDAAGHGSTTTGQILVRGLGITAGSGSVVGGNAISIPLTVTSLAGLGVRSGQLDVAYNRTNLTLTSVTTPAGTLLNGWGHLDYAQKSTGCLLNFYDVTDLTGSGVLCYLNFATDPTHTGANTVSFTSALCNETLPALRTSGTVTVSVVPTIVVSPDVVTKLAGQTQQYTLTGTVTAPVTWSVLNPAVASISSTGLLTALSGGVTQVKAVDAVGATDVSASLTVNDLQVTLGSGVCGPGGTVRLPITSDRLVGPLNIRSMQFQVGWTSALVVNGGTLPQGLWSGWGANASVSKFNYGLRNLVCNGVGSGALANSGTQLATISLTLSPSAVPGTVIPLTLTGLMFNEGSPRPVVVNGQIVVDATTGVPPVSGPLAFALGAAEPNPVHGSARIPFSLPAEAADGSMVRLAVYDLGGRRVSVLAEGALGPGPHEARWDGRDSEGHAMSSGLYFTRLEWSGRTLTRRLVLAY